MLTLESKTGTASGSPEHVYRYISDFRNFAHLLPSERLSNLEIGEEKIRFDLEGLGTVGLVIREKLPYSTLVVVATEDSPADFAFTVRISEAGAGHSEVRLMLEARLNMFLEMMARNPLQQFIDLMIDKLAAVNFQAGKI